jgi:hypothetical protein
MIEFTLERVIPGTITEEIVFVANCNLGETKSLGEIAGAIKKRAQSWSSGTWPAQNLVTTNFQASPCAPLDLGKKRKRPALKS